MGSSRVAKLLTPQAKPPAINVAVMIDRQTYIFQGRKQDASALQTIAVNFAENPELNFTDEAAAWASEQIRLAAAE